MPTPTAATPTFSAVQVLSPNGVLLKPAFDTGRPVEAITQSTSATTDVTTTAPRVLLTTYALSTAANAATVFQFYNPNIRAGASLVHITMQGMYHSGNGTAQWPIEGGDYGGTTMPRVYVYNIVNGGCTIVIHNPDTDTALSTVLLKLAIEIVN